MLHTFQPGQLLLDKYRVERVLGAGGMGMVIAARHLALDELVAIKFMLGGGSQADLTRFVREARAAVRLRSQHVARVLDVAALEDGTPYMVLEHLNGSDLAHMLRERGPLPVSEAVDAILQACEAIAEAHSIGIVHRDIKPANLFLTRGADGSPCIKVLDFGIAKWSASTAKMDASQPMGSAPYMAPEQFAATNQVDPRTDVWALGATLFDLLTGKTPFHRDDVDSIQALMHAVLLRDPMRPRMLRADLPEALEAVLLRCLDKDQAARFPSVAKLAAALVPFGSEHASLYAKRVARVLGEAETSARAVASSEVERTAPVPQLVVATAPLPQFEDDSAEGTALQTAAPVSRKDRRVPLVAGLVIAVAVGGIFLGMRLGRGTAASPSTATEMLEVRTPPPLEQPSDIATGAPITVSAAPVTSTAAASVADTPARVEVPPSTASQARTVQPPRRVVPAAPVGTPSSTSSPKENLYGRRR
ncbi:serine/threonine-protein kinase [Polyangium mundeleinium]|uniref:Protein kinase n=1 Tax=Polyangium mundeleinium TaxID=2995306 RepID=A0ABT5EGI9_9BACT|nr:serine/threonine-protein kinase [Polyangium mundeleinium]MDC0740941.1 protein kinase [Polyangium mundeleinium]